MEDAAVHDPPDSAKASDQMPEEAPAEQVPDDAPHAPEGGARESGQEHARRAAGGAGPGRRRHASGADAERESRDARNRR